MVERPLGMDVFSSATCTRFWSRVTYIEKKTWSFWFLYHSWSWRCWRTISVLSDTSGISSGEFTAFWMSSGRLFAIGDNFDVAVPKNGLVRQNIMNCRECCKSSSVNVALACEQVSTTTSSNYLAQFVWVFFLFLQWPFFTVQLCEL